MGLALKYVKLRLFQVFQDHGAVDHRAASQVPPAARALAEYAEHAPPIDYRASFDSLDLMEGVMRHFYLLALIEQRQGADTDWGKVNSLMRQVLAAAEKVAKYRHHGSSVASVAGKNRAPTKQWAKAEDRGSAVGYWVS
jgi:hypothetical protein